MTARPPVGIVGAGPVGLVTALRLASFGVPSVVLEADPELRRQGSKACLVQGDAMEVLDKVGCARTIADEGVTWHVAHTYVKGREIRRAEFPRPIGYGPFVNISQYRVEQVLLDRLLTELRIDLRWAHRVTAVRQDEDGVTVEAATPDGDRTLRFSHLVACDGVRSTLRELVGVEWTGYTHRDRFLITDVRAALTLAKERHFHYDPPFNPGRQLVMHPQPDDVWRIDWQLPPDADIEAERGNGALDRRVRDVIGDVPYEIEWLSTYRFHQRVVDRFTVGRVFFAGDAAHALPPYGSRGMNSGIQDADNLAWKLALVLAGRSRTDLLDSYHTERHAAARENLAVTEATIRFMVPPTRWRRLARNAVLTLSGPLTRMRRHVNSGRMAEPFTYTDSPIVRSGGNPVVGAFAPDGWVERAGERVRLRTLFGAGFVCLRFTAGGLSLQALRVGAVPEPGHFTLADPSGRVREIYRAQEDDWFLVRPDGHIAASGGPDVDVADVLTACALAAPTREEVRR